MRFRSAMTTIAAFIGGVAFVQACDEAPFSFMDAGSTTDAADCSSCEEAITADRIYRVWGNGNQPSSAPTVIASASCDDGDILLGGGCWIYPEGVAHDESSEPNIAGADHELIVSGPKRYTNSYGVVTGTMERWVCMYDNREDREDLVAEATAICFHPSTTE